MKYFIIEEDSIIRPLYKSFFPVYRKSKEEEVLGRIIKQYLFRKTLSLYVDNEASYRALGGLLGEDNIDRFRVSDYPSWSKISGIDSYTFPTFKRIETAKGGLFPECHVIKDIVVKNEIITVHTELLQHADSPDSLTKVRTVFYEYVKSWWIQPNIETLKTDEQKTIRWFISQLKQNGIKTIDDANWFIERILDPNKKDSGIVRKAKSADFIKLQHIAKQVFEGNSFNGNSTIECQRTIDKYDTINTARQLYGMNEEHLFIYGVYDNTLLSSLISSLEMLADEAKYLSSGICTKTVDGEWAKNKVKELQNEWNESGFDMMSRGDTKSAWECFKTATDKIKSSK